MYTDNLKSKQITYLPQPLFCWKHPQSEHPPITCPSFKNTESQNLLDSDVGEG